MHDRGEAFNALEGEVALHYLRLFESLGKFNCTAIGIVIRLALCEKECGPLPRDIQDLATIVGAKLQPFAVVWNGHELDKVFPVCSDSKRRFRMVGNPHHSEAPAGTVVALKINTDPDRKKEKNSEKVSSPSEGLLLFPGYSDISGDLERGREEGTVGGSFKVSHLESAVPSSPTGKKSRKRKDRPPIPTQLAAIPGFVDAWNRRIESLSEAPHKPPTCYGEELQLKQGLKILSKYGAAGVMDALDCVANVGWTGFRLDWYERGLSGKARTNRRDIRSTAPEGPAVSRDSSVVRVRVARRPGMDAGMGKATGWTAPQA
jgi:hypothetical protein